MSYQVIARKWRPKTFKEVVGQKHVVLTLQNAISIERIAHAYLFAGSRGVGKTSTARIFARALNCVNGPCSNPCNECENCKEILDSRSMDVLEIDGASNTSVDDVRDLRESVKYAPAKTRYKIYIIDEVHMLSKSAFNALLKTLEEPPSHLIFIFATTELNKIPETILSRCQYFEFKQISLDEIAKQLEMIAKSEGIEVSFNSLKRLARAAEGSMRDAESLLDQIISYSGKNISDSDVTDILGMAGQELLKDLVDKIIERDTKNLLSLYQEVIQRGQDIKLFSRELQEYFRNLSIVKISEEPQKLINLQEEEIGILKNQAKNISLEQVQYLFNTLLKIEFDLKNSPVPAMVLEMALIRMSRYQPIQLLDEILKKLSSFQKTGFSPTQEPSASLTETSESHGKIKPKEIPENNAWGEILSLLKEKKSVLNLMMSDSEMAFLDGATIRIRVPDKITIERLKSRDNLFHINEAIREVLGSEREVHFECGEMKDNIPQNQYPENQPESKDKNAPVQEVREDSTPKIIEDAIEVFGGTIIK